MKHSCKCINSHIILSFILQITFFNINRKIKQIILQHIRIFITFNLIKKLHINIIKDISNLFYFYLFQKSM